MRLSILLATLAVSSASAGAQLQRFDLECADTVETNGDAEAPYVAHYRIDLVVKRWCEGECRAVKSLADVQSSFITLEGQQNSEFWHAIDREKGEDQIFSSLGVTKHTTGSCIRKPFSGFPNFKTKF